MSDSASPTILVVDDNEEFTQMVDAMLSDEYEVRTAMDALDAAAQLDPEVSVMLLDRRMPGMSGDDLVEHVRDWDIDVRISIVSAVDPDQSIVDLQFDDYLSKPVSRDDLIESIEQLRLFDKYEELLSRHNSIQQRIAILRKREGLKQEDPVIQTLEEQQRDVDEQLESIIDSFSNAGVASIIRQAQETM